MKKYKSFEIIFLISPNIGYLDMILPLVEKYSKQNYKVGLIFPDYLFRRTINFDDTIWQFLDRLNLNYLIDFELSKKIVQTSKVKDLRRINLILKSTKFLRYVELKFAKLIRKNINNRIYIRNSEPIKCEYVFLDIYVLQISHSKFILSNIEINDRIISIHHALKPIEENTTLNSFNFVNVNLNQIQNKTSVLSVSNNETFFWMKLLGINENAIKVTGIIRHQKSWISKIQSFSSFDSKNHILLISRPNNERFLSRENKADILRELVYIQNYFRLGVIYVRLHPKETSKSIFFDILGKENYGTTWKFSELHPYVIGENAFVCITLWNSNVISDMNVLETPVIQRSHYTNSNYFLENNTHLSFKTSMLAYNQETFVTQIKKIIDNRAQIVLQQKKGYLDYFKISERPLDEINLYNFLNI